MVVSGNYNSNNQLVYRLDSLDKFDMKLLSVVRPFTGDILRTAEGLSNSTYVKRMIIRDQSGFAKAIIGKFTVIE